MSNQEPKTEDVKTVSESLAERQSQLATVLIGVLVIIAGFLTYNYFKTTRQEVSTERPAAEDELVELGVQNALGDILAEGEEEGSVQGEYTVQPGDSLWDIAEAQLGDGELWREIALTNNISTDNPGLEVGQVLQLPEVAQLGISTEETTPDEEVFTEAETEEEPKLVEETPETAFSPGSYVVQRGDTLWEIAEEVYGDGARWREIFDANPLSMYQSNGRIFPLIHAGNVLVIP